MSIFFAKGGPARGGRREPGRLHCPCLFAQEGKGEETKFLREGTVEVDEVPFGFFVRKVGDELCQFRDSRRVGDFREGGGLSLEVGRRCLRVEVVVECFEQVGCHEDKGFGGRGERPGLLVGRWEGDWGEGAEVCGEIGQGVFSGRSLDEIFVGTEVVRPGVWWPGEYGFGGGRRRDQEDWKVV